MDKNCSYMGFFHLNMLFTFKPMEHLVFQNPEIILVFAITYLTILFNPEARVCSFSYSLCLFCMWVLLCIVSLPQAWQLYDTDPILYYGCLSQYIDVNGWFWSKVCFLEVTALKLFSYSLAISKPWLAVDLI